MMNGELGPDLERYLLLLFNATNGALKAGVPIEAIVAKGKNKDKKFAKKNLKKLKSKGYCVKKPRGRNITWYITKEGRDWVLRKLTDDDE